jgi:hypothetical protein
MLPLAGRQVERPREGQAGEQDRHEVQPRVMLPGGVGCPVVPVSPIPPLRAGAGAVYLTTEDSRE